MQTISIGIYHYPHALKSAVYGLEEVFLFANQVCKEQNKDVNFTPNIFHHAQDNKTKFNLILLPPALNNEFYIKPDKEILEWIKTQHKNGSVIASACAGAFILAAAGITKNRKITTHWGLAEHLHKNFPSQPVDINKILIDHGDIISAGGIMSWLDLGLEIITQYTSPSIMRQVGKLLVVDTAPREQRYYQQFKPSLLHGDQPILELQQWININYAQSILIKDLAEMANMTQRTLQRRFIKATQLTPNQYIQRIRMQKACELLEITTDSFELIANRIGYEDASSCRKVFIKIMGLTPIEFRKRFIR